MWEHGQQRVDGLSDNFPGFTIFFALRHHNDKCNYISPNIRFVDYIGDLYVHPQMEGIII